MVHMIYDGGGELALGWHDCLKMIWAWDWIWLHGRTAYLDIRIYGRQDWVDMGLETHKAQACIETSKSDVQAENRFLLSTTYYRF